jgi:NADPH:quinone reductase-like Zn-dependent oxidoreductase
MKATVYHTRGGDPLKLEDIEKPTPNDDEVLIKSTQLQSTHLTAIYQHPLLRRLIYVVGKAKFTRPGRDVAGKIEAVDSQGLSAIAALIGEGKIRPVIGSR